MALQKYSTLQEDALDRLANPVTPVVGKVLTKKAESVAAPVVTMPTPTAPVATAPATMPVIAETPAAVIPEFTYNTDADALYQAESKRLQSQIAQQMAARGILGSSISQERTAESLGSLGLQYRQQALSEYNTEVQKIRDEEQLAYNRKRQEKEDAWTTAQERGYFNNQEALLWGLTPGTKTASTRASEAAAAQDRIDAEQSAAYSASKATSDTHQKYVDAVINSFPSQFNLTGQQAIVDLLSDTSLSDDEIRLIIAGTEAQEMQDKTAQQIFNEYLFGTADTSTTAKNYNELINPSRGGRGQTK